MLSVQPDAGPTLAVLRDLRARILDALLDQHPPESAESVARLAADLVEVHRLSLWCRDAVLAYARLGDRCKWAQLAAATGLSDATLQSRHAKWYEREAESA